MILTVAEDAARCKLFNIQCQIFTNRNNCNLDKLQKKIVIETVHHIKHIFHIFFIILNFMNQHDMVFLPLNKFHYRRRGHDNDTCYWAPSVSYQKLHNTVINIFFVILG